MRSKIYAPIFVCLSNLKECYILMRLWLLVFKFKLQTVVGGVYRAELNWVFVSEKTLRYLILRHIFLLLV